MVSRGRAEQRGVSVNEEHALGELVVLPVPLG